MTVRGLGGTGLSLCKVRVRVSGLEVWEPRSIYGESAAG